MHHHEADAVRVLGGFASRCETARPREPPGHRQNSEREGQASARQPVADFALGAAVVSDNQRYAVMRLKRSEGSAQLLQPVAAVVQRQNHVDLDHVQRKNLQIGVGPPDLVGRVAPIHRRVNLNVLPQQRGRGGIDRLPGNELDQRVIPEALSHRGLELALHRLVHSLHNRRLLILRKGVVTVQRFEKRTGIDLQRAVHCRWVLLPARQQGPTRQRHTGASQIHGPERAHGEQGKANEQKQCQVRFPQ